MNIIDHKIWILWQKSDFVDCNDIPIFSFKVVQMHLWSHPDWRKGDIMISFAGLAIWGERSLSLASTHAWGISGEWFSTRLEGPVCQILKCQQEHKSRSNCPFIWSQLFIKLKMHVFKVELTHKAVSNSIAHSVIFRRTQFYHQSIVVTQ